MELTHRFTVPVSIDVAWSAFNDLEQIAPCFPGAALTSFDGERFEGVCKVKLGPVSLQYTGSGRFVERDEEAKRALIEAKGKDKRGNGTAAAAITAQLTATDDSTTAVEVKTDLNITGRPAQFGRGVMQDVSDKLLAQFSACLEDQLGSSTAKVGDSAAAATPQQVVQGAEPESSVVEQPSAAGPAVETAAQAADRSAADAAGPDVSRAEPSQLNLGSVVLPVLARRYAPVFAVALVVLLVVVRRLAGRRR